MANGKKKRGFITYKSYLFREKDPVIDLIRTARSDAKMGYAEVADKSSVSISTVRNWERGKTRKPLFATSAAVLIALGKRGIGFRNGKPYLID